jgi:hypothetical protein
MLSLKRRINLTGFEMAYVIEIAPKSVRFSQLTFNLTLLTFIN